jgi:hypothetical protein
LRGYSPPLVVRGDSASAVLHVGRLTVMPVGPPQGDSRPDEVAIPSLAQRTLRRFRRPHPWTAGVTVLALCGVACLVIGADIWYGERYGWSRITWPDWYYLGQPSRANPPSARPWAVGAALLMAAALAAAGVARRRRSGHEA